MTYRRDVNALHDRIVARLKREPPELRTLCAWCGALIRDGVLVNGNASHGICGPCRAKYFPEPPEAA